MKNITLSIDDEIHRQARIYAAEQGTSLSALVKEYLTALTEGETERKELKEMPVPYKAEPSSDGFAAAKSDGPPYMVNGKKVYTKDGKPRKPGAMRGLGGWTEDFDEWPDGFIDAMYGDDTPASNKWWKNANDHLKKQDK